MAFAALTGLAEIAVIESQKFERGGEIHGPSHNQGGVKYRIGNRIVELEGGEGVINKRSMALPGVREKASELNQLGGGVAYAGTSQLSAGPNVPRYNPTRLEYGGIVTAISSGSGGASIDYNKLGQVVVNAVRALPPQYVRVGDIRSGVGKQVRVENKAEVTI